MTEPSPDVLVPMGHDAEALRASSVTARAEAQRQLQSMERQHTEKLAEFDRKRRELEAELARQRAELEAQMAPLREHLSKLQETMWSVDLYLGRDEQLQQLRDGDPAPANTPLTIRQRVLVMAEESLVLMDRKPTGMDHEDVEAFCSWLLADDANLNRVLPDPKGVVVLVPTRVRSDSENVWEASAKDELNRIAWWLIRNGEQLYLLTTDPQLRVGKHLLPLRDEFAEVYEQRLFGFGRTEGPVAPGSDEWMAMEKIVSAKQRHYMRIMLVLQGLVNRTTVWHPLPPGGVNLLSIEAQTDGRVRLLQDADTSIQLGDGRESFADWQARLNSQLRPGMRLVGNWRSPAFNDLHRGPGSRYSWQNSRLTPPSCTSLPKADEPHLIEGEDERGLLIRFKRTDLVYRSNVPVPDEPGYVYTGQMPTEARQRATLAVQRSDSWVIAYDLASVDDMRYYLNSRDERSQHFLTMVPTLRAALDAKLDEQKTEAPFRVLLRDQLLTAGADPDTVDQLLDELVTWWKVTNKWARALNGDQKHEAKALRAILTEYRARQANPAPAADDPRVAAGRAVDGAIAVAVNRRGQWFAYSPSPTPYPGERVWLDITPLHADDTTGEPRRWASVSLRSKAALTTVWCDPQWEQWDFAANPNRHLTGPEREQLTDDALARSRDTQQGDVLAVTIEAGASTGQWRVVAWRWTGGNPSELSTEGDTSRDRYRHRIAADVWMVAKNRSGIHLTTATIYGTPSFDKHQHPTLPLQVPWDHTRPKRGLLLWVDEQLLQHVAEWNARCTAAKRAAYAENERIRALTTRYTDAIATAWEQQQQDRERARFVEDYGPGSDDLWEAHRAKLRFTYPITRDALRSALHSALSRGESVEGRCLRDLLTDTPVRGTDAPGWALDTTVPTLPTPEP